MNLKCVQERERERVRERRKDSDLISFTAEIYASSYKEDVRYLNCRSHHDNPKH